MIFTPKLARAILAGKKTQTRRKVTWVAADDKAGLPTRETRIIRVGGDYEGAKVRQPCRYRKGNDYALQLGRGNPAQAGIRLRITDVGPQPQRVCDITLEDAIREGFKTRDDFFDYWRELYGEDADLEQEVWVITFQPKHEDRYLPTRTGEGEPTGDVDPLTGERTTDYLSGATSGALKDAGEAIPEHIQQEYTAAAHEEFAKHQQSVPLERRLEVVRDEARQKGIDMSRLDASIERRVKAYEKRVRAA